MQISITVTGLDGVEERLKKLGLSLHNFAPALESLGAQLIRFYSDTVFSSSGTALGSRWRPLSESTEIEKNGKWPGRGILERTGAMKLGFYSEITPETLFVSNKVPYFRFHQLGTGIGTTGSSITRSIGSLARAHSIGGHGRGRNLPARPMIGVNARVEAIIKKTIQADIKAKIESTNG